MDRKLILIAATKNKHKIEEFRGIFSSVSTGSLEVLSEEEAVRRYDVESAAEYVPPEETGKTFAANAFLKAAGIYRFLKVPLRKFSDADILIAADDSGLCVNILDGAPGVLSARYASTGKMLLMLRMWRNYCRKWKRFRMISGMLLLFVQFLRFCFGRRVRQSNCFPQKAILQA